MKRWGPHMHATQHPTRTALVILSLLLVATPLGPLATQASTTTTTFASGGSQETVTFTGGTHNAVGLTLTRNTTITSASMFIRPDPNGASPGQVTLDANQDGQPEWAFNQPGYGGFGHQTVFSTGNATASVNHPPFASMGGMPSPDFLLPYGASISSASVNVSFVPSLESGFHAVSDVMDVAIGDVDNDTRADAALLGPGQGPNVTADNRSFSVLKWNATAGVHTTPSIETCNNASTVVMVDLNMNGYDDVAAYDPSGDRLCLHIYNATIGAHEASINVTLPSTVVAHGWGDMNGNGRSNLVTVRNGGVLTFERFNTKTNSFLSVASTIIYSSGTGSSPVTLTGLYVDRFGGPNSNATAIAIDNSNDGIVVDFVNNNLVETTARISDMATGGTVGDFDADGDLDLVMPLVTGHRSVENQGNGWNGDSHNGLLDLTNATIFDHDNDGNASIFLPKLVNGDGNSSTIEGNITYHGFRTVTGWQGYDNRVDMRAVATGVLSPWTAPRSLDVADLDGDGVNEHVIVAGEGNSTGVFVSAWHHLSIDVDHNGQNDLEAQGYSGNGSLGLSALTIEDTDGNLTSLLNSMSFSWSSTVDGYGITMSPVNFSVTTEANGDFHFTNLNVTYGSDFLVDRNPHLTGNLSNVLNQAMTLGTGDFTVPLTLNSTQNGSIQLRTLTIQDVQGAANLALPPTPVPVAISVQPNQVVIEWQNASLFGDDLQDFVVYKTSTPLLTTNATPYERTQSNLTIDAEVQPGQTWWYWVRSTHDYGVTSNLSQPLEVAVPYPLPASFVPDVVVVDRPNDDGGVFDVSWGEGHYSIAEHHLFVSSLNFTNVSGLTPAVVEDATARSAVLSTDSNGAALLDGTAYYVAVIGVDEYGNFSESVDAVGPVYTRNDTVLASTLNVTFAGFIEEPSVSTLLLKSDGRLDVTVNLTQNGTPLASKEIILYVRNVNGNVSQPAFTDANGLATFSINRLSTAFPTLTVEGPMTLEVIYPGSAGDVLERPTSSASASIAAFGALEVTFTHDEVIELNDDLSFSTDIDVHTADVQREAMLANMMADYHILDAEGVEIMNGTAEVRGSTMTVAGFAPYDGVLEVMLNTSVPTFYTAGMGFTVPFEASPVVDTNETNGNETNTTTEGPTFPDVTLPATVDCGTATYEWDSNATDVTITCAVTNPNPFATTVDLTWQVVPVTPPSIEVVWNEASASPVTVDANGSADLTFTLVRNAPTEGMFPGLQGVGYIITLSCTDNGEGGCSTMTQLSASTEGEIRWTLGDAPANTTGPQTNLDDDEASSAMTPVVVGVGVFIAIVALLGGVLVMRRRGGDVFEDEGDEDDYMDGFPPAEDDGSDELDLSSSRSLDDLKDEGRDLYEDAPEGTDATDLLNNPADAFVFGATEEVVNQSDDRDENEGEDDGITVDEHGTEWWEDEDGTWWYREDGWEDWAVWEE
jgi:hypothetical protein